MRELIVSGLREQGRGTREESSAKVIDYLEGFGALHKYATDMESLLREGKPLDKEKKAALVKQFEAAARKAGQESWNKVLGLDGMKIGDGV